MEASEIGGLHEDCITEIWKPVHETFATSQDESAPGNTLTKSGLGREMKPWTR